MRRQTHPSMLCCTHSNDTHHSLLTQGVDSTSVNRVYLESTKHQRKRTPPTLWCRKFVSTYHIYDRLRFMYNNTPSPGWIVRRAAHCGTAFLSEDTATGCPKAWRILALKNLLARKGTASGVAGPSSVTEYILRLCCQTFRDGCDVSGDDTSNTSSPSEL